MAAMSARFGSCRTIRPSGARGRWGKRLLVLRGGIVIPGASSGSWPFVRPNGYYSLSVGETVDKFIPILLVGCFFNPILERAVVVDGDFRYVGKEETQVSHDEVFVVEERASHLSNVVAARSQHLLCWPVEWTTYCLPNEIKLACSYHVGHTRYVIKHSSDMFVLDAILTHFRHRNSEDPSNVAVKEDFELV